MPYKIKKRKCKDSKNKNGNYVITKKNNNKKISCHSSLQKAKQAIKAKYIHEDIDVIVRNVFMQLLYELSHNKNKLNGSNPDESYELFNDKWFDMEGLTTSYDNRQKVKNYLKQMKLL